MKSLLVIALAALFVMLTMHESFGEKSTFFDTVTFIQYLDENTALEEVRNGNLDMYYYRIPSDRLEDHESKKGLQVFDSTTGSYSILLNPAESGKFNPFSKKEIRFAMNYLVDRKLIVNELMGGYGIPMYSYYSRDDPEFFSVLEQLEKMDFSYNANLANEIITNELKSIGAVKKENLWFFNDKPIEITIFIRSDDPVRKSIGEILSTEMQKLGFKVIKEFGDLNKAYVVVYGSNPAELKWNIYTEGWGRTSFTKYDSVGLAQMYAPWFANMPGFKVPSYWNYENDSLDSITQKIYTGNFSSADERKTLVQNAVREGVDESIRIFLASKIDQYVVNEKIKGVVNDFGAGITSRFTPINAKGDTDELKIGVKQIYQGAWNPVGGFGDSYSRHIWNVVSDPGSFKHPFSGETIPVRVSWNVDTDGPNSRLDVPKEAIRWDVKEQKWKQVPSGTQATSKITFDFRFSHWHNGQMMDINDILHAVYFVIEWGTPTDGNDKTFDTEFTPRAEQTAQALIALDKIDEDTIDVYVDYWHFDKGEIAEWASIWSVVPWEISEAMEQSVLDGKMSYSRADSANKNIDWLSLLTPKDSKIILEYLNKFKNEEHIPNAFHGFEIDDNYLKTRYDASIHWIEEKNHAVISNGPFFLESYSPESRTITISSFDDENYPFTLGHWSEFEEPKFPEITNIEVPITIDKMSEKIIEVKTKYSDSIIYFISDNKGNNILSDLLSTESNQARIILTEELLEKLDVGANNLKVFAVSDEVMKPDYYQTSFVVTENNEQIVDYDVIVETTEEEADYLWVILAVFPLAMIIIFIINKRRSM
ncbi:MAG: ABC transporter substrate-binding protein [Nitrosarchaeum sp.]|nr:ABC transporter substrate-binding protein [Nitrosarchaeum sp.]